MSAYIDDGRKRVKELLILQLLVTILVPLFFLLGGVHAALSSLIGAGIALLACAVQAQKVFGPYRAQNPDALVGVMMYSEATKMILVGALFAMVFHSIEWLRPISVFSGFIIVYLTPLPVVATGLWNQQTKVELWPRKP